MTGALTFVSAPNFEASADADANNVYEIIVQVSDGNGGIDTQTIDVTVTDVNEAPVVGLPGSTVNYTEGDGAVVIDGAATASDSDSADFDTGTLTVDFTATGTANDRLAIRDQGPGPGNIQA